MPSELDAVIAERIAKLAERVEDGNVVTLDLGDAADLRTLLAAVERGREDSERLDALEVWMSKGEGMGVDMWRAGKYWGVGLTEHHDATTAHSSRESTLRAALDAARAVPDGEGGRDA